MSGMVLEEQSWFQALTTREQGEVRLALVYVS